MKGVVLSLVDRRKQLGINQVELARILGVAQSFVCQIEKGKRAMPRSWKSFLERDDLPDLIEEMRQQEQEQRASQDESRARLVYGAR